MREGRQNLIIFSKLQAPEITTKTLRRKRLLDLLSENKNKKLILLCAGAGYGKTTLLSQFILTGKISYVYYHLEKSDAEPVVFFSYLIAGIRKTVPKFGKKTERLSRFFNYPQRYLEIILGTFINEILENIKEDIYIILEDYHLLSPSDNIDRIVDYLLNHLPPCLHLIISSRILPSFSLSQLRARDEMFEFGGQHLRFTKEEIKDLFGEVYSISLKESELSWIEEHSEGWPTSLRLMLQSSNYLEGVKASGYVRRILVSYYHSQANLFNYFAQEIYNRESRETRRFLVDCSVLEWLTPELCDAIVRKKNSEEILANLTTRNSFVFLIPGIGFKFHTLFKDFLRTKLTDIDREKRIYRRAGNYYYRQNNLEEAVKLYLQANEYVKVATIIERIGFNLIQQGRSGTLCSYIEKIPKSIRVRRPLLLMNYAQALIYVGRSDEARDNYLRAVKKLKKKRGFRKKYAEALYALGGISLNQGKFNAAKRWFKKALRVSPQSARLTRASILNSIASIFTAVGGKNLREAITYLRKALQIAQKNRFKELEASILNNWAMNEFKAGNLDMAYAKLSKIVNLLTTHFSPGCGAGFYNAAKFSLLLGRPQEARSILDSGLKVCSTYNDLWSMASIWQGYALLYQELGDFKKAKQFMMKTLEVNEKLGIVEVIAPSLNEMCRINIQSGELAEAEKNLSTIWALKSMRSEAESLPFLITKAKLKIAQGMFQEAENILSKILEISRKAKQTLDLFLINIELSKVYHFQGRPHETGAALKEVLSLCRYKGYEYLLLKALETEKWMLQTIMKENIEKKYVISVVKKAKLDIHWIDAFLFGIPRVLVDDRELADEIWKTIKAKKLFFYLLLHKNEKVSQDSLIEAFWQSASFKSGSDSLRKAIQHIRHICKTNVTQKAEMILLSKGCYQLSPKMYLSLDTEEFENLVIQAKGLKEKGAQCEQYLKKAVLLYREGFAVGWYDTWTDDFRHHYQGLYEDCLGMIASLCMANNKVKDAIV